MALVQATHRPRNGARLDERTPGMGTRTDRCGGSGEGDQASQVPRPGMDKPAAPSDSALPGAAGRTADPFMSLPVSLLISLPVDPASLVLVLAAYLLAGMVKGALGFGLPLTAIAILARGLRAHVRGLGARPRRVLVRAWQAHRGRELRSRLSNGSTRRAASRRT